MFKGIKHIHGPYTSCKNEGRRFVSMVMMDNTKRFVSYPKFLVECVLGRPLDPKKETIDHIDRNFENNVWSNLRIVDLSTHVSQDRVTVLPVTLHCLWCGTPVKRTPPVVNKQHREGKAGPFCSRRCRGCYSSSVQHKHIQPFLPIEKIPRSEWVYIRCAKVGGTNVAELFASLRLDTPTETQLVAAFPRYVPPGPTIKEATCVHCSTLFEYVGSKLRKYCSPHCASNARRVTPRPSKETLTCLVSTIPMTRIGAKYNVSDNAVRKWCVQYGINTSTRH